VGVAHSDGSTRGAQPGVAVLCVTTVILLTREADLEDASGDDDSREVVGAGLSRNVTSELKEFRGKGRAFRGATVTVHGG
jgi:hypothetical protein